MISQISARSPSPYQPKPPVSLNVGFYGSILDSLVNWIPIIAMPAETSNGVVDGCLSLEEMFQRFPGVAAAIAGCLDQSDKKALRTCSRSCKAAVDPLLTHVTVAVDIGGSISLLQRPNWGHLQELHLCVCTVP